MRRSLAPLPVLISAVLLLAGCAGDAAGGGAATTSSGTGSTSQRPTSDAPASTTAGTDDESDAGPFPASTGADEQAASDGARVTVTDIRAARQDGFDRVVFVADGEGLPGWDVRYVDSAVSQGSGAAVDVAGDAVLQVTITGAGYPFDTGVDEYAGVDPLPGGDTQTVTEVAFDGTFEGTTVAFVGTRAEVPFRAYLLENPARVVVEVADPS